MRLTLAGPTLKRCSNLFQTNLWQGSKLIAETDNDKHWQSYLYEPDSYRPLALVHGNAQQDNIKLYWYQNDHLGTPIALTGSLGDTLYECQYNAYGQIINETYHQDDIDFLPNNPLRFQGQYYDEETGLHYNLNRYYDPFTGRYITQDPLGILGGLNSYQYVNGDPINWIDPLELINTASKGNEKLLEKTKSIAIDAITPDIYSDLAIQATKNGQFDKIMLGKYNEKGISYVKEAKKTQSTYFELDNWSEIAVTLGEENMWKINEAFLEQQVALNKTVLLSHNPYTATGYFSQEVNFLIKLNYYFVKEKNYWRAIKSTGN
ncbi:hypothetical protein A9G42_03195 [Gilliamella sp. Nev6-6]|uniref:RHS repeat-associated core domain-containing protein n=1 Tax=Gilliamella sp. Nev6-6 TaxID=3120252 RepID=UPI00080F38CB|nr:RHS repeat-associated core domain-containing protein [Gilliamella apicola]OCG78433.1 hypothetical protein A9G42_03195 [Gilliamella apicola]